MCVISVFPPLRSCRLISVSTDLEDLREEARTYLLTEEIVAARQTGHSAPQGSVGGRADPVGCVDTVERRLVRAALTLLGVAEATLGMVVHGAGKPPCSSSSVLSHRGNQNVC